MKVILDSNALFAPIHFKIDIFQQLDMLLKRRYTPILLSPVRQELERLARGKSPKTLKEACFALRLAEKCKLVEVDADATVSVDDLIVKVAGEWNCPVFTNDRQLKRRLRDINVPVIHVRQKSQLRIEGRLTAPV